MAVKTLGCNNQENWVLWLTVEAAVIKVVSGYLLCYVRCFCGFCTVHIFTNSEISIILILVR